METVIDFILGCFRISTGGDCSHEIERCLLLGRKTVTNLDSILKSRCITLPKKIYLIKAMVFQIVLYGCQSWNIEKAEWQRIDGFALWCWKIPLKFPWTARSNQSVLRYQSWRTYAKAETPIFWPPDAKNWLIGKDPDDGKNWRQKQKRMTEGEMVGWHHWLHGHESKQAPGFDEGQGSLACCWPWFAKRQKLSDWTDCLKLYTI